MTLRDASLSTDVQLRNAGDEPLEFTAALHTYLATHRHMSRECPVLVVPRRTALASLGSLA